MTLVPDHLDVAVQINKQEINPVRTNSLEGGDGTAAGLAGAQPVLAEGASAPAGARGKRRAPSLVRTSTSCVTRAVSSTQR
jgi:hypothetical protein